MFRQTPSTQLPTQTLSPFFVPGRRRCTVKLIIIISKLQVSSPETNKKLGKGGIVREALHSWAQGDLDDSARDVTNTCAKP